MIFSRKNSLSAIVSGVYHISSGLHLSYLVLFVIDMIFQLMLCWWVAKFPFILQEHLLIVCELLKANLYEFHKFNRESGGEVYFTMPRLQVCGVSFSSWQLFYFVSMLAYIPIMVGFCSQLPFSVLRHFSFCMALA